MHPYCHVTENNNIIWPRPLSSINYDQAGPRVREIFTQIPETGTEMDYNIAKQKLKAYFDPQKNRRYEVYHFRCPPGPPFNGDEYARYLKALGIQAKFSTPYWPKGNATVERFMRLLRKALKTATLAGDHGNKN